VKKKCAIPLPVVAYIADSSTETEPKSGKMFKSSFAADVSSRRTSLFSELDLHVENIQLATDATIQLTGRE
jgi:hypothetical protein